MNLLRKHPNLETMLRQEVVGVPNPRQAAESILKKTTGAHALVLFKDKQNNWTVVPVGEAHPLHTVGAAAGTTVSGKRPVAVCYP